jgi:hypothetical protein
LLALPELGVGLVVVLLALPELGVGLVVVLLALPELGVGLVVVLLLLPELGVGLAAVLLEPPVEAPVPKTTAPSGSTVTLVGALLVLPEFDGAEGA